MGTATAHRQSWRARADDWAAVQEWTARPLYDAVLDDLAPWPGATLLDLGCGAAASPAWRPPGEPGWPASTATPRCWRSPSAGWRAARSGPATWLACPTPTAVSASSAQSTAS